MTTEAQSIIDVTLSSTPPHRLELGHYYVVHTPGGIQQIDLTGDEYRDAPRRKTGTVTVRDVPSFLAYFHKHRSPDAEIYADRDRAMVTAVLDAHSGHGGAASWQSHRVTLQLRHSDSFRAWKEISGTLMAQTMFAEFVEDHRSDVREPSAADLLELAQTIQGTTKVTWKSSSILRNGQRQLQYVEQVDATAGQRGEMVIPDHLTLGLAVYDGAEVADAVTARLRYRIDGEGRLRIGVILDQLSEVVATAFEGVIAAIAEDVPVPILRGEPPA